MIPTWYQYLPSYIDPVAFTAGSFAVRWYSLSYVAGFVVVYLLLRWRIGKGEISDIAQISKSEFLISKQIPNSKYQIPNGNHKSELRITNYELRSNLLDFLLVSAAGALAGGRLGYLLFYGFSYFANNPLSAISPYGEDGRFSGIYGMSFYGGAAGAILASYLYARLRKLDFLGWADFAAPAIGAGYFFGRVGNFLNGELWGRVTNRAWGMYFPSDSARLLRHPSQLYEALGEGLLLFVLLWIFRNKKCFRGTFLWTYLGGYALVRFFLEFFREPGIGERLFSGLLTKGQLLSLFLVSIAAGCVIMSNMNALFSRRGKE